MGFRGMSFWCIWECLDDLKDDFENFAVCVDL